MKSKLTPIRKTLVPAALLFGLTGALGPAIHAGARTGASKTPVVVELFTSEGCSSCPPAEKLLQALDEKQPFSGADLVVLSEHVDYWNDGGWVDPYSSKLLTARQRSYAEHFRLDSMYTPQAVVDGERETVGSNAVGIRNAVEASMRNQKVALTVANSVRDGNRIKFHLTSADLPGAEGPVTVYVAVAENKVQSNIAGGENGGRSLTQVAIVRALAAVGAMKGGSSFLKDITIPMPSGAGSSGVRVVAFLQDDKSRQIVGATYEEIQG
ncbi:MAG TPA: DUF1223 domain-containing protein [Bryobacteraceae bacterium]|jgi:hypothetical protein|nr:DUF1223 domain-containing protein [Bryobacteraceae bacterium]